MGGFNPDSTSLAQVLKNLRNSLKLDPKIMFASMKDRFIISFIFNAILADFWDDQEAISGTC